MRTLLLLSLLLSAAGCSGEEARLDVEPEHPDAVPTQITVPDTGNAGVTTDRP
jgi:hypothetical protein